MVILRLPATKVTAVAAGTTVKSFRYSSRLAARADGIDKILLPLPLLSCGKSAPGNTSMRPSVLIATTKSVSGFLIGIGLNTLAPVGRVNTALPALFRLTKSRSEEHTSELQS